MTRRQWEFSDEVVEKAHRYLAEKRVTMVDGDPKAWNVRGSAKEPYRVRTDATDGKVTWVGCSCAHGKHTAMGISRCSHAVAVLLMIRDGEPKP